MPLEDVASVLDVRVPEIGDPHYDDPSLALLFTQLKSKTLQTAQGTSEISGRTEFNFVLQIARVFCRMGASSLTPPITVRSKIYLDRTQAATHSRSTSFARGRSNAHRRSFGTAGPYCGPPAQYRRASLSSRRCAVNHPSSLTLTSLLRHLPGGHPRHGHPREDPLLLEL